MEAETRIPSQIEIQLKRIADAQEGLLAIAAEARHERMKLAEQMKAKFKAGFAQEREDGNKNQPG